jgi:amino acid adenylation domain-containing protein
MEMISEFLEDLARRNVELWFEGDALRWRAPKGELKEDDRTLLTSKKAEVIHMLKQSGLTQIETFPLAYGQRALWYINQSAPESAAYNVAFSARICSEFNMDALRQAIQALVDRHSSLRTTYAVLDGEPIQQVHGYMVCPLQIRQVINMDIGVLKDLVVDSYRAPFDLEKGPLLRAQIFVRDIKDYILLLSAHHIACDGWSMMVLIEELRKLYSAYQTRTPLALPRFISEFAPYVEWQRKMIEGETGDRLFSFWQQQLRGELMALNLPTDKLRPPTLSYNGATHSFTIGEILTASLKSLARNQGATLFTLLVAAFHVLLHRYTGQGDILIGSPTYGRNRLEFSGIVGDLINTVVLRGNLTGNPPFRDFLAHMRHVVLEALEHQDYPFSLLVEKLRLDRDLSRSPIYQTLFILQNFDLSPDLERFLISGNAIRMDFGGIELEPFPIFQQEGQMELVLEMVETGGQLFGNLKFNTDLFTADSISRMASHFVRLLESIVTDPKQRLSELTLLTELERHQILVEWNATGTPYLTDKTFVQLFEEQVGQTPEAVAVICKGTNLTYAELNRKANQLASYLRELGVGPDALVGICMERSVDMVVGLLGVLKAGGAYVPLDPSFPMDRLQFMLEDSGAPILLTESALSDNLAGYKGKVVCVDSDWKRISIKSDVDLAPLSGVNHLAYVIYTSGSTGQPKGVQIPHRALVNFLYSMRRTPGLSSEDTVLSVTTISFDIFGLELFLPLVTGAKVVLVERDDAADGARLIELLRESGASVMQATPATWRLLLQAGWEGERSLKILCGGEALPHDLVGPLLDRCREFWNLYGPTETTIWSTAYRMKSVEGPVLIGSPIANTQTYILDNWLHPVPVGVVGELYIGGDGLARGYLNRPELTEEKFIPNPFSGGAGGRIYKTGDLARYRPDGNIECLGRVDHQVKLRGFRIELGEIESRLKEVEGVNNCVVVLREDRPGDQRLVAYYVVREGQTISVSDVRYYLQVKLPNYMVPQHFVELESIPLTPNGKVDRDVMRLLPLETLQTNHIQIHDEPLTEMEQTLTDIWKEVLGLDHISVHDNFFELGGHSLLSIQVVTKLERKIGFRINPGEFIYQTLGQLAASLEQRTDNLTPRVGRSDMDNVAFRNQIEPFYFRKSPKKLYGCHHLPQNSHDKAYAIVLCYPIGQEYIRSHRAFYQLAVYLSRAGFHVLRFDYFGCGDSEGDFEEGSLLQWTNDIQTAIAEIQRRSGLTGVCLIGLRVGATLALQAVADCPHIESVILWEPVFNGKFYLRELAKTQRDFLNQLPSRKKREFTRPNISDEVLGFPMTSKLKQDLEMIHLDHLKFDSNIRFLILGNRKDSDCFNGTSHFKKSLPQADFRVIVDHIVWTEDVYKRLIPLKVISYLVNWVSRVQ